MNWDRGFKRLTLFISIVAGLQALLFFTGIWFDEFEYTHTRSQSLIEEKNDIELFWEVWNTTGWVHNIKEPMSVPAKKSEIVKYLLDDPYSAKNFERESGDINVHPYKVWPDINAGLLKLSEKDLEIAAQSARKKALTNIKKSVFWGRRTDGEVICLSIAAALPFALVAYILVWLIYHLLRWFVLGFAGEKKEIGK